MSTIKRRWLVVAAAVAVGASGIARADDAGDNGMNPMYGDSYATLEGQGHNAGSPRMAPEGAFAAHEMDGRTTPLTDQMRQSRQRLAEQTRHNWDTMVQKTHAMADKVRTAFNTQTSTTGATTTPSTTVAPAASGSPSAAARSDLTDSTTAPTLSGVVVSSPPRDTGQPMVVAPTQSPNASGYRIAPVNPKGQAPTVVGPSGG